MSLLSSPPEAAPAHPAAPTDRPETSSWRPVVWLLGLLIVGLALIIGLQSWFSSLIDEVDAKNANEQVRLFIGEEISRSVESIETDVYRLAATSGIKGQQQVVKKIRGHMDKLNHDIQVLNQGGRVRQNVDLNLEGQDQMIREVHYQPTDRASTYVLELIELVPWLDEIHDKVRELLERLQRRDAALMANDARRMLAETDEITLFLKRIPPLFSRLSENTNRLLYESQRHQTAFEQQQARQKRQLEYTKRALVLLLVVAILLPGMLALRQINASNKKLRLAWEDMRLARDDAQRANLAKSEFLSRMSHELRTPLNAILGFGQLLELEIRDKEQADSVQEILRAGHHLLDLINEVLDLARIEAGKLSVSMEPVPLAPLLQECLTLIQPMAEQRGIRVIALNARCSGHVRADRTRLKQVLLNLLSNAVKYNREGGTINLACVAGGDTMQVRISDTGAGLTPVQQARLFTAFERLDADKAAIEGTGIGLALSRRLMEAMAGEVGVESAPGQGSTFWVRLPASDVDPEPAQADAQPAIPAVEAVPGRARLDVLCIEDNPANLRLVERILSRRNDVRLLTASAPGLGLELAAAHRPALILLDINLPEMDGYEVMDCLRQDPATRDIPVVAVSANAMPKDLARGKAAGFAHYLTKPLHVDRLVAVLDDLTASLAEAGKESGKQTRATLSSNTSAAYSPANGNKMASRLD
jgi:signal transduction histidine kinase/CheY-like chemotaxis protein